MIEINIEAKKATPSHLILTPTAEQVIEAFNSGNAGLLEVAQNQYSHTTWGWSPATQDKLSLSQVKKSLEEGGWSYRIDTSKRIKYSRRGRSLLTSGKKLCVWRSASSIVGLDCHIKENGGSIIAWLSPVVITIADEEDIFLD